jgi:2-methylcitrate dehydratase PrpD
MNSTESFIADLYELAQSNLPAPIVQAARLRLLDYAGVTLAGAAMLGEKGDRLLQQNGAHRGRVSATVIGFARRANLGLAALVNGISAHVAELDDGERYGMVHPGAPVISAVLAVCEARGLAMADLLRGIVVGYEATIRLARAMQPGLKDQGYHATGVCGSIGAALGAAAALQCSPQQMNTALAAAASSAAGLLNVIRGASELKPFNAGRAAQAGVGAWMLAEAGFVGPSDVLDGQQGLLHIMSAGRTDTLKSRDPGEPLAIERVYVKPYAACRHCHAPIEAVLRLRERHGIRAEQVRSIRVISHRWAVHLHDHKQIDGCTAAKMSIPYSVAVALQNGAAGLEAFSPRQIRDPVTESLTQKVSVVADQSLTAQVPRVRPAIVEVTIEDGPIYRQQIDLPKGEPETALTSQEVQAKFRALAEYAEQPPGQCEAILTTVLNEDGPVRDLIRSLQKSPPTLSPYT